MDASEEIVFLKLGGSLITDKTRPYTVAAEALQAIAAAIAESWQPGRLLLGHGSGSFGHTAAKKWHTREGLPASNLPRQDYWTGFAEVWRQAAALHGHVIRALQAAGLPAIGFAPSAAACAQGGRVRSWETAPLRAALRAGLLPVVYGDVVFDQARGGTILSTEEVFAHLAAALRPRRILLAGREAGVFADYPQCDRLLPRLTPASLSRHAAILGASHGADVTGGMAGKVRQMLSLLTEVPALESVHIFGGLPAENIRRALNGDPPGTTLARM